MLYIAGEILKWDHLSPLKLRMKVEAKFGNIQVIFSTGLKLYSLKSVIIFN